MGTVCWKAHGRRYILMAAGTPIDLPAFSVVIEEWMTGTKTSSVSQCRFASRELSAGRNLMR